MRFRLHLFCSSVILLIISSCTSDSGNNPKADLSSISLQGKQCRDTVSLHYNFTEKTIRAQEEGKIEHLFDGSTFDKKILLVQFDDYDAFVSLSGNKEALKEKILASTQKFPESLNPIKKKWTDFAQNLSPEKTLPPFPSFQFKEEAGAMWEANIIDEYNALILQERAIGNHFQLSTEAGVLVKRFAKSGDNVKKNARLLTYIPQKSIVIAQSNFDLSPDDQKQIASNLEVRLPLDVLSEKTHSKNNLHLQVNLTQKITIKNLPSYFIIPRQLFEFDIPASAVDSNGKITLQTGETTKTVVVQKTSRGYTYKSQKSSITVLK